MEYGQKSWLGCAVVCFLAVVPIASVKHSIEDGMPNVALHKNIVLSNVSEDESRLAVDGNTDRKLGLCIIIETDGDVWWQVDLDDVYTILNILVIPTENFHVTTGQRTNFNLTTGDLEKNLRNTDYVVVNDFIQHTWEFVLPFPTRARFLKVHKKDGQGHFQLCEMEVYGTKGGRTRNLILLFWSTREEKFKLTLDGRIRDIHNFYTSIVARFLELQLPFEQYFHLCEVEVYGKIAECQSNTCKNGGNCSVKYCDGLDGCKDYTCTCPTGYGGVHCENCVENVAIGKDIIASSTAYSSWLPNNVIDGDTNQYVINGATCVSTQKEAQPYLIIDLGVEYTLSSVRTYKRLDCCPDDISEFQLLIMLKTWISYEYTFRSTQVVSTIDLNPFVTTRLVRLQAKGAQSASLQLCEIEVFAVCQEGMTIKDEPIPLMQLRFSLSDEYTDVVKSEDSFIYWIRQELSNYTGFSLESFRNVKLEKDPFRVSFELHSIDGNLRTLRSMLERVDKLFKQGLSDLQTEDGQKLTITPRSLQYHVIYLDSTGAMLNGALLTTVCMLIVSITHM